MLLGEQPSKILVSLGDKNIKLGLLTSIKGMWERKQHTVLFSHPVLQGTVKRVDEVVPYRHLVTQDQTTQVSNKFLDDNRETYCLQMSN